MAVPLTPELPFGRIFTVIDDCAEAPVDDVSLCIGVDSWLFLGFVVSALDGSLWPVCPSPVVASSGPLCVDGWSLLGFAVSA